MKNYDPAASELDRWISETAESGFAPMVELSEKISRHREDILNPIRFQANSAKSRAVNTTIKVSIKMARGFRNIANMIALIYLKCSDLVIPLHNRPQMTANELRRCRQEASVPA